jgi:hypothetical protein
MPTVFVRKTARGGRPKAAEPGLRVSTWIKTTEYDRLVKRANAGERSVSSLVRLFIKMELR